MGSAQFKTKLQEESMQRQYPMFMSIYGGLDEAGVSEKIREDADVARTMNSSYYGGDDDEGPSLLDEVCCSLRSQNVSQTRYR